MKSLIFAALVAGSIAYVTAPVVAQGTTAKVNRPNADKLVVESGGTIEFKTGSTLTMPDGAINSAKIATGAIDSAKIATGAVDSTKLATVFFDIKTKAQFSASTPAVGQAALCSDCAITYQLCTATAAVLSGWRASHSATVGCGTGG